MGNRLTLPLLFLAALLAGGAFFWMSGGERRGAPASPAPAKPVQETPAVAPAELATPAAVPDAPKSDAPARVELGTDRAASSAARAKAGDAAGVALRGTVLDRFGTPIAGARVTIAADGGFPLDLALQREFSWLQRQRTETDADGHFLFDEVEPGALQVAVRAAGFAPYSQRGLSVAAAPTELEPFELARGALLSGVVVDPDGRGVGGARILQAELDGGHEIFLVGEREPTAVTAADGTFRIDVLACGAWRFVVRSEDHPDLIVEGTTDEPGVEQGGLRWQLAPGATIAGTVTDVPAAERGKLEVRAARGTGGAGPEFFAGIGSSRVGKVEANGAFRVRGLRLGENYTLEARRAETEDEQGFWQRSRSNNAQAKAGDTGVVLAYQPEAALTFTVYDGGTRAPLEHFQVEAGIDWPIPLSDDDGRTRTHFPGGLARAGGLRPGADTDRVQLRVNATGYREHARSDIALRAGQELDLGAIYLDPVPVVRVRVLDQESHAPIEGANVRMQKQQEGGGHFAVRRSISISDDEGHDEIDFGEGRSGTTDADGWATITSFEGETVELSARAQGYATARLPGLFLPRGESSEQELRLSRGGEVMVHVLDAQGAALAGARVEHRTDGAAPGGVVMLGGGHTPGEATDSEGKVLFENLAPGQHSFRLAESTGGGAMFAGVGEVVIAGMGDDDEAWSQAQVTEGERSELTLRAAPRSGLEGRVREAGKVLAGATLRLDKEGGGGRQFPMMPGMGGGPSAKSDGEGRYAFQDVKEGRYKLIVEHPTRRMPAEFAVELREGDNSFDVDLPLSIVAGRIVDHEDKPIAGARVWAERQAGEGARGMRFRMVMMDDSGDGNVLDSGQFGERATTDADGRYTLRGVTSDVDLVIKAEGDTVQPGKSETLRVAVDEVRERVDLVLLPAGSIVVEAHLADGNPGRMQLVQAEYLDEADPPLQPQFGFLAQGSTELKGLKPGRWRVNVRSAQEGPAGTGGQDQEIVVEPAKAATAKFQVE